MISTTQREALVVLQELCELCPDVRLGQLFAHLGFLGEDDLGRGLGYMDDDELLAFMYRHRDELLARLPSSSTHLVLSVSFRCARAMPWKWL